MFIDSHCHLNYRGLVEDQQRVLGRARNAGVSHMVNISTRSSEWDEIIALAESEPDVSASIGIHPHEADAHKEIGTDALIERAAHPKVVGIGETGLDFFYDHSDRDQQQLAFRTHIAASRATGLPLIIHSRDAESETLAILAEELEKGAFPALIHCFTGSRRFAEQMVELGLFISISGIVTFKNARDLQETAKAIPDDRLLIETDAPFLAPVPHRGKTCEPAFVADTARFLAGIRGVEVEGLGARTSDNFRRLFTRAAA